MGDGTVLSEKSIVLRDGSRGTLVRMSIPSGDAGIRTTLGVMADLAQRDADSAVVHSFLRRCTKGSTTSDATVQCLYETMVRMFPYVSDPTDREFVHAPIHTLARNSPYDYRDCDDLSTAFASLLTAAGVPNRFRVISWRKTNPPLQYTHVYNEWWSASKKKWFPSDIVMGRDGWKNQRSGIKRTETYDVLPLGGGLSDAPTEYAPVNYEAIGKDILSRSLPTVLGGKGEAVGAVLQEHAVGLCVGNVKHQIYLNRYKLVGALAAVCTVFFGIGYVTAVGTARKGDA
jgi:hypothetical protein